MSALLDLQLSHLRERETQEAHNALDVKVPPIAYSAISHLLVAIFLFGFSLIKHGRDL